MRLARGLSDFSLPSSLDSTPIQLPFNEALARLKPWLKNPVRKKVGQHMKYDEQVLANYGIALAGIEHDTLLDSYVLESHRHHDLDSLAQRLLQIGRAS